MTIYRNVRPLPFDYSAASLNLVKFLHTHELSERLSPNELRNKFMKPSFDISAMTFLLDHDNHEMRMKLR